MENKDTSRSVVQTSEFNCFFVHHHHLALVDHSNQNTHQWLYSFEPLKDSLIFYSIKYMSFVAHRRKKRHSTREGPSSLMSEQETDSWGFLFVCLLILFSGTNSKLCSLFPKKEKFLPQTPFGVNNNNNCFIDDDE